jgi:hypothetical protein
VVSALVRPQQPAGARQGVSKNGLLFPVWGQLRPSRAARGGWRRVGTLGPGPHTRLPSHACVPFFVCLYKCVCMCGASTRCGRQGGQAAGWGSGPSGRLAACAVCHVAACAQMRTRTRLCMLLRAASGPHPFQSKVKRFKGSGFGDCQPWQLCVRKGGVKGGGVPGISDARACRKGIGDCQPRC